MNKSNKIRYTGAGAEIDEKEEALRNIKMSHKIRIVGQSKANETIEKESKNDYEPISISINYYGEMAILFKKVRK